MDLLLRLVVEGKTFEAIFLMTCPETLKHCCHSSISGKFAFTVAFLLARRSLVPRGLGKWVLGRCFGLLVEYPQSPQQALPSLGHMLAHSSLLVPYFQTLLVSFAAGRSKSSIQSTF